ncbi:MAG: 50S ribosomal protein L30 [Marinilabiliaceae bacterium]|nr:50S ribosomal protein L30 [Marinilabiliaceae bacterium]
MAKIKITQIKSRIGATKTQKATLDSLGLSKIRQTVEHEDRPEIIGMVRKVEHLVSVEK